MGKIFIFVGIVLIGAGVIISQSNMKVRINHQTANAEESNIAKYALGGGVGALGGIFILVALAGMARGAKETKRIQSIMQNGIEAEGTVTFADKNYTILVNHNPIYSIVEYTYKDKNGSQHTRRINNMNSEIVIRKQIVVGSIVPVKYSAENPNDSIIVL